MSEQKQPQIVILQDTSTHRSILVKDTGQVLHFVKQSQWKLERKLMLDRIKKNER